MWAFPKEPLLELVLSVLSAEPPEVYGIVNPAMLNQNYPANGEGIDVVAGQAPRYVMLLQVVLDSFTVWGRTRCILSQRFH